MKTHWILAIFGLFLALTVFFVRPTENLFVPEEMVGRWTTSEEKYKDRFLELSRVSVVFGTGKDRIDVHFVTSVEKQVHNGSTIYTVYYKDQDGNPGKITFYWDPAKKGQIRLRNQDKMTWNRTLEAF